MTLYELLKKYKKKQPDLKIKIGANNGNSFFYMGTVQDMFDGLAQYDKACQKHIIYMKMLAEDAVNEMLENPLTLVSYAKLEMGKARPNLTYKGYEKSAELWFKSLTSKLAALETKKMRCRDYVVLRNRKVLDAKMADPAIDPGVLRIQVEGYEYGRFWELNDSKEFPVIAFSSANGHGDGAGDDE